MSSVPAVLEALNALYGVSDQQVKDKANKWLESFQKTPEAWMVADALLRDESSALPARLFAAQTFRSKIIYDLVQLDDSARLSLKESLLAILQQNKSGPLALTTQICLSLAALALQLPQWKNVYQQFVQLFFNDPQGANCLLEFLTVLPEEINSNTRIPISDEDFAARSAELLADNAEEVLQLLEVYMQSAEVDASMRTRVFRCLNSWLQSGDIHIQSMSASALLNAVFDALEQDELFDVATDVVCEVIHETREVDECMPVINRIYPKLFRLRERLAASQGEDEDLLRGICRIFTEAAEAYTVLIVRNLEGFSAIVQGLLECMAFVQLDISKMTFNFWYALSQLLDQEHNRPLKPKFEEIFVALEATIIRHLRYPDDLAELTAAQKDEFREFRHDLGDILKDCSVVLGAEKVLSMPCEMLVKQVQAGSIGQQTIHWQDVEAPLFSFRALGAMIAPEEERIMPQVMELLAQLPDHPRIRYAATLVIGRYTQWTAVHPEYLEYQLNYISSGFSSADVVAASAMSLKYLCKDCSKLLVNYLQQLHTFYMTFSEKLSRPDLTEVTEAIAHVISAVPEAEMLQVLQTFCTPLLQQLSAIASKGTAANEVELNLASDLLERLVIFITFVDPYVPTGHQHPTIAVLNDVLVVLEQLAQFHSAHTLVSESISRCYKSIVETYRGFFVPFLPQLLTRIGAAFAQTGLGCYLWVARKCVHQYGAWEEHASLLFAFVDALSNVFFNLVKAKKPDDIPDVIEEYFRLILALQHEQTLMLLASPLLSSVFQCSLACIESANYYALSAVLDYLVDLLYIHVAPSHRAESRFQITPAESAVIVHQVESNAQVLGLQLMHALLHTVPVDLMNEAVVVVDLAIRTSPLPMVKSVGEAVMMDSERVFAAGSIDVKIKAKFIGDLQSAVQANEWLRIRRLCLDIVSYYRRRHTRQG